MKIYGSIFVLLGAARLAASAVLYPSCANQVCFNTGAQSFCAGSGTSVSQVMQCMCSSTNSYYFFLYLYYCEGIYCSEADVKQVMETANGECKSYGYDASDTINSIQQSPLEIPTTFSYPTLSLPMETSSFSRLFDSPSQTITSSNDSTGSPNSSDSDDTPSTKSSDKSGLSTGAIIGIVVGAVAVIGIIAGLIVFCTKHKAKERRQQAMNAPPPAPAPAPVTQNPAPVMSPPPMSQYSTPTPPVYPPYAPPVYPPQQQPILQQQQQPLMQGYQEFSTAQGYFAPQKEPDEKTVAVTTSTTPASPPTNAPREYFQELAADERPRPAPAGYTPGPVGHTLAQADQVYVEMPADSQKR